MTTTNLLVLCSANRCRSPLAAAMLAQQAGTLDLDLRVDSAGLLPGGQGVPADGIRAAVEFGVDPVELRRHRSRTVSGDDLVRADLVITMTREHARVLVADAPDLWPRVFTLKQLSRWLDDELAGHQLPRRTDLRSWVTSVGGDRSRRELVGRRPEDDVVDPFNRSQRVWAEVAAEIQRHCRRSLELSLPLLRPPVPR